MIASMSMSERRAARKPRLCRPSRPLGARTALSVNAHAGAPDPGSHVSRAKHAARGPGAALASCGFVEQRPGGQGHHLRGVEHVIYHHVFVGLMREIENSRAIGDAVAQFTDPIDVLLVIGSR